MRNLLREFGFDAMTASSGDEALATVAQRKPDLILLDRNMPGMSGDETLHAIRAREELASVPVFILSGAPLEPDEVKRLGATAAVLKPFDVPSLLHMMRTQLAP